MLHVVNKICIIVLQVRKNTCRVVDNVQKYDVESMKLFTFPVDFSLRKMQN